MIRGQFHQNHQLTWQKSFCQIGGSVCLEELVKDETPCIIPTENMDDALLWCVGLWPISKSGISTRWRVNWIRPAITAYCSITWSHLERSLCVMDLYSCKIMTQSILVNSARGTLKTKRDITSFNWCLGRRNQWTKISLKWWGMNLTKKSTRNSLQIRLTFDNFCRKTGSNDLQSTSSLWWKEWQESVKQW